MTVRWMNRLALVVALAAMSVGANADRIELTNGDVITGKVRSVTRGSLVVETDYAPRIVIDMAKVASIATDETVALATTSGTTLEAPLAVSDGKMRAGDAQIAVTDIKTLRRDTAGASLTEAEWSHKLDLAASLSKGNSDTQTFALLSESTMAKGKNEHALRTALFRDEAEDVTTRDQQSVAYDYKRFVTDKWFYGAQGEYFRDKLKNIDPRITLGAGGGYRFWDNSLGSLTTEFGVSAVYEDLDVDSETNPALRWALDYRRLLAAERLEAFYNHQLLKILDSDRGEVWNAAAGLRFLFDEWWDASIRADFRHETDPPEGSHRSDITYSVGVGVRF